MLTFDNSTQGYVKRALYLIEQTAAVLEADDLMTSEYEKKFEDADKLMLDAFKTFAISGHSRDGYKEAAVLEKCYRIFRLILPITTKEGVFTMPAEVYDISAVLTGMGSKRPKDYNGSGE